MDTRETLSEEELLYSVAIRFYQGASYADAHKVAKNLTYRDPLNPKYYQLQGNILQAMKEYKPALQAYKQAFFVSTGNAEIAYCATQCAIALGDWNTARQWFETCLHFNPNHPQKEKMDAVLKSH